MFPATTKILVVDDSQVMRDLVELELRELGFTNITKDEDGADAMGSLLGALSQGQPFQLVITDWKMVDMTGIDLLKGIRNLPALADLPVIMVTSEGEKSSILQAVHAKVNGYLIKPFTRHGLKSCMEKVWRGLVKHDAGL